MKKRLPTVTPDFLKMAVSCNVAKIKKLAMPTSDEPKVKIDRRREGKIKQSPRNCPILTDEMMSQLESAIIMYTQKDKWKEWGLASLREGGSVILLEGSPGTGKTMAARYLSKKLGRGIVEMSMKDIGGKAPGDTERALVETFKVARAKGWATIFLDEADSLLVARDRIGQDSHYMIGVINELLMQISSYHGLIQISTNRPAVLDPALTRRILVHLRFTRPERPERRRIWQQKLPDQYPFQPTQLQLDQLSEIPLTGAEIENAIILCASRALLVKELPTFATLQIAAKDCQPANV